MPRVTALEVMHFTPDLDSMWTSPPKPEMGQQIRVDARVTNLGNLEGSLNVGLWAWEAQPNSDPLIIRLDEQNVSLDSRQSILLSFDFEAYKEGDLQVYLVVNEDVDSRVPIDLPVIREEGASLTWFERVFGDGPLVLSILIIACTGLGFSMALFWLRDEEDEHGDEWIDDEDDWPEPPDAFPDETPPPIPPGLGDVQEEEE